LLAHLARLLLKFILRKNFNGPLHSSKLQVLVLFIALLETSIQFIHGSTNKRLTPNDLRIYLYCELWCQMFIDEVRELVELNSLQQALDGLPGANIGLSSTEQLKRLTIAVGTSCKSLYNSWTSQLQD